MHCKSMSESPDAKGAWQEAASAALRVVKETVDTWPDSTELPGYLAILFPEVTCCFCCNIYPGTL